MCAWECWSDIYMLVLYPERANNGEVSLGAEFIEHCVSRIVGARNQNLSLFCLIRTASVLNCWDVFPDTDDLFLKCFDLNET